MENSLDTILKRLNKHYITEGVLSAGEDELSDFLKSAYADQVNASDYKDSRKISLRRKWLARQHPDFKNNPAQTSIIAKNLEGKIVGHFGIMNAALKAGRQLHQVAWGRDLIILPSHRKLGIGPFLIDRMLKNAKENKYSMFLIAGLNDQVYPIYKKFGFTDLGYIPLYLKLNNVNRLFSGKINNRILVNLGRLTAECVVFCIDRLLYLLNIGYRNAEKRIAVEKLTRFDKTFDGLWERISGKFPLISKRDSADLNWRFIEQPYWNYTIFKATDKKTGLLTGYIVLRRGKSRGFEIGVISDIFSDPRDKITMFALLKSALSYFKSIKEIEFIRCNILHRDFEKVLARLGFARMKSSSRFMVFNLAGQIEQDFISQHKNWFVDYADSDLDLVL